MSEPKTTTEIIEALKKQVKYMTSEDLRKAYIVAQEMATKFKRTGQEEAAKILWANVQTLNKEQRLIDLGYNKYFQKADLEDLVGDNRDSVFMTKLKRFERPLPEKAICAKEETDEIFDEYFVLYTDYTGKEERKIAAEAKEHDPILLGSFLTKIEEETETREYICRRLYVVAEWEDAWCDLSMEKLIDEYKVQNHNIVIPDTEEALAESIRSLLPPKVENEDERQD